MPVVRIHDAGRAKHRQGQACWTVGNPDSHFVVSGQGDCDGDAVRNIDRRRPVHFDGGSKGSLSYPVHAE